MAVHHRPVIRALAGLPYTSTRAATSTNRSAPPPGRQRPHTRYAGCNGHGALCRSQDPVNHRPIAHASICVPCGQGLTQMDLQQVQILDFRDPPRRKTRRDQAAMSQNQQTPLAVRR